VVSVTNGAAVQTLTNVDFANWYTCAAWDNAGNLYGASTSANLWRVWSPPGANTNTTAALAQVVVSTWIKITSVTASRTSPGCATVTLAFTANENVAPSAFQLTGSSTLKGVFTPVGATITGSAGSYQAVFTNCSAGFYLIEQPAS